MNLYTHTQKKRISLENVELIYNMRKRSIRRSYDVILNRKILFILVDIDKECTQEN